MKLSKKVVSLVCVLGYCLSAAAYGANYWQDLESTAFRSDAPLMVKAKESRLLRGDIQSLQQQLSNLDGVDVELPLPNGQTAIYHFEYSPIAEQGLLDKYPQIRTFRGVDIDNPNNRGRFDISPAGFRGMFRHNGETVFIDPQYIEDVNTYISYRSDDAVPLTKRPDDQVLYSDLLKTAERTGNRVAAKGSSDGSLRTYRLAVAATGEYTDFFSDDTDPITTKRMLSMAAITTAINRVNEVFESDLGIRLVLIANNDQIVYVDATTDPYFNDGSINDLGANQVNLDTVIGSANYDIGHLFGTGSGGVAALESVCNNTRKARGLTGLDMPTGDPFYIDFVSHEIGHQFGGNHTFNGTTGSCGGFNRNQATAYEPGGGSTIMAYADICGAENLPGQDNSDPYFHAGSIEEITNFITSGGGASCAAVSTPANAVPDATAGADVTIPANTPIVLTGSATDGDGDTLTYVWEQLDAGTASSSVDEWIDDGSRAIFRSLLPTTNPVRFLPNLDDLIDNELERGESIPTTNRNLNFRLTVRDGNGGTAFENKVVAVTTAAGPFDVLTPETDDVWTQGTTVVTWDVAGTDLSPVNCPQVNISYDGNLATGADVTPTSFATVLATNVPNDGLQLVNTPTVATLNARVMVSCSNNVFYAVSVSNFEVSASSDPIVSSVSNGSATEGNPITFTIVMSAQPLVDEIVDFELATRTAGADDIGTGTFSSGVVNNNDGTLTVPAGVVTFTATVNTNEDSASEPDETFVLSVGSASGVGTIIDDDSGSTGGGSNPNIPGSVEGSSGGSTNGLILFLLATLLLASRKQRA